ncbi:hypothetical protein MMC06_001778 [Schaereria dolodes]|nr:hypothetical protein [Schaereria dolodes]
MASRLSWLSTCKASQLKAIAVATGVNSGGTKSILNTRLLTELQQENHRLAVYKPHHEDGQHGIISIDMGIRNLAYCRIALLENKSQNLDLALPVVEAWDRIAVSRKVVSGNSKLGVPEIKETFDPLTYSCHAHNFISSLLKSGPHPNHILIERQRFRSMGGSAVQEWTLRVNMFEAMLYAVLKTMKEQGVWKGQVWPVAPNKVAKFWLSNEDGNGKSKSESKSKGNKGQKIELVKTWLENKTSIDLQGGAKKMGAAYLANARGGKRTPGPRTLRLEEDVDHFTEDSIGKLDDLADCLLQGVAWIEWETNKKRLYRMGIDALGTSDII